MLDILVFPDSRGIRETRISAPWTRLIIKRIKGAEETAPAFF